MKNASKESNERRGAKTPRNAMSSWRLGALAFISLIVGCHQAHLQKPMAKELMASDPDSQIEFWHDLTDQPVCCNDAAFHGLLLYLDNKDDATDYVGRVAIL